MSNLPVQAVSIKVERELSDEKEPKTEESLVQVRITSNSVAAPQEFLEVAKVEVGGGGILYDIGKPSFTRNKDEKDKDIRDIVRYNIEIGDGTESVRMVIMVILQNFRDPLKASEYLSSAYKDKKINHKIRQMSAAYLTVISGEEYLKECHEVNIDEDLKECSVKEMHGELHLQLIIFSKLRCTWDLNIKLAYLIMNWVNGEISLVNMVTEYCHIIMMYYLNRYGFRLSICYISLLYRISVLGMLDFNKYIAEESYDIFGLYDYRVYSTRGMFNKRFTATFSNLKTIDKRILDTEYLEHEFRKKNPKGWGKKTSSKSPRIGFLDCLHGNEEAYRDQETGEPM